MAKINSDILFFSKKSNNLPITVLLIGAVIISLLFQNEAWAERHFWVYFHELRVIQDHDPRASAEWYFTTSINGQQVNLKHLNNVNSRHSYWLQDKRVEVTIPDDGTIRMLTTGFDEDGLKKVRIPDLSPVTRITALTGVPEIVAIGEAVDLASTILRTAIATINELDSDDPLGILVKDFNSVNNFGQNWHSDRSDNQDYELNYLVEEFKPMPTDSLIVEVFTHSGFSGSSTFINKNTRDLGGVFHDSITNVRVTQGPGYQPGDILQICADADYGNPCITLGPGDHDIGTSPYNFNDKADSIWFIRP